MGQTLVTLRIYGPLGSADIEALADTGATFTKIPRPMMDRLGLQVGYQTSVELGDGRTVTRLLALADIEINGVRRPVLVSIGGDGEHPLVGYTTLESLGCKVNPVTHALEATPAIEY